MGTESGLSIASIDRLKGGGNRGRRRERVCAKRRMIGLFDSRQFCLILPRPSLALTDTLLTHMKKRRNSVCPHLSLSVFPSNIQVRYAQNHYHCISTASIWKHQNYWPWEKKEDCWRKRKGKGNGVGVCFST